FGQVTIPAMLDSSQMLTDAPYPFVMDDYRQVYYFEKVSQYFYAEFYYTIRLHGTLDEYYRIYYPLSIEREIEVTHRGLFITIFHSQDRNKIFEHNGVDPNRVYDLFDSGVRVIFANEDWIPE